MCANGNTFIRGQRPLLALVVLLAVFVLGQHAANALPMASPSFDFNLKSSPDDAARLFAADNACYTNPPVETLCQRCAKLTKSNVVYPMCCKDEEEARAWCDRYLNFGLQGDFGR